MKKLTLDEFINRSKNIHNNLYNYILVDYINTRTKVKIVCPIHGIFEQTPALHLSGCGCFRCFGNKTLTTDQFVEKSKQVHGDRYNYDLVEYTNHMTKVKIICPIHGVFEQKPNNHLQGQKCLLCVNDNQTPTTSEFISKSKKIHSDRYDYSLTKYKNYLSKVKIICHKHGIFEQSAFTHYSGSGCPKCSKIISNQEISLTNFVKSVYNGRTLTNTKKIISPYELDIYLPDIDKAFEYNGAYWHQEGVNKPMGYHQMKTDLCASIGIELHHIWEKDWVGDNKFMKECIRRMINCG
jgi:hypothetical protein